MKIRMASMAVGDSAALGLESMQYFIESIKICESIETQGTGYSNTQGCLDLYQAEGDSRYEFKNSNINFVGLADVARTDTTNDVDLLEASLRARLPSEVSLTEEAPRSDSWGLVSWYPPITVRGEIALSDGSNLYAHDD